MPVGDSHSVGNEMQHTMKEGNETDIFGQFTRCSPPQLILLCTTVPFLILMGVCERAEMFKRLIRLDDIQDMHLIDF